MAIGKIIQPTVVNQKPMNQRNTRWEDIKLLKSPHPATDWASFGYWFNYFWEEARETDKLAAGDQARLCEAFFAVFDMDANGVREKAGFDTVSDDRKRSILITLLVIGFERIGLEGFVPRVRSEFGGNASTVLAVRSAVSCPELQEEMLIKKGEEVISRMVVDSVKQRVKTQGGTTMAIGFRGDGRPYEDLVTAGGFLARARSDGQKIFKECGFDKPWHPFGLEVYRNSLFLRKGHNKDNCLHTVVSIGVEFNDLVAYPLLTDPQHFPLCRIPLRQWTQKEINEALAHKWKVRTVWLKPNVIDHIEHELRIYVVRVDHSSGFSTQGWQRKLNGDNPFPEIAVNQVRLNDILAEIVLTRRYFHPGDAGSPFELYDLKFQTIRLLPSDLVLSMRFGDQFPAILRAKLSGLEQAAKVFRSQSYHTYENAKRNDFTPLVAKVAHTTACRYCGKVVAAVNIHEKGCPSNPAKHNPGLRLIPPPPPPH